MADFRKYVLAFAGLACTAGLTSTASAQTINNFNGLTCAASASTPFDMRAEGVTEQAGDLVVLCTGGTPTPSGSPVPQVNITITANANITSRLLNGSSNQTEAVLLVDDPQPGQQSYCPSVTTGCPLVGTFTGFAASGAPIGGGALPLANSSYNPGATPVGVPRYNAYGGILGGAGTSVVSQNIVTFFGVPIDPPGANSTLSLRITDVRLNVSSLGSPAAGSFSVIPAYETVSSSSGFTINNPVQTVGNVRRGLIVGGLTAGTGSTSSLVLGGTTTSGSPSTLPQCTSVAFSGSFSSTNNLAVETVNFSEGFATATKLRVPLGYNIGSSTSLSVPGNFLNSESQFVPTPGSNFPGSPSVNGLADTATRIKLTFNNVPAGVTVFVPTSIVNVGVFSEGMTLVSVTNESATAGAVVSATTTSSFSSIPGGLAAVTLTSGSGVAIYEVTSQTVNSPLTIESFAVPVFVAFTASPSTNSPGLGISTVNVDFSPSTASVTTATAAPIPRFIPTSTAANGFTINACSTVLLFPFMSNLAGFDTGVAIASTSTDPFGTLAQTGSCTLNFYGSGAPAAFVTPTIPSGTVYTNLVSTVAPGFQGYMIAQCRFQYGHGFAFITDGFGGPGRGLSEGYLALVIPDPSISSSARNPAPAALPGTRSGENLGN